MDDDETHRWFETTKQVLETAYLAGKQPWQQSGVGLHTPRTAQDWEVLRKPIADCLTFSGTFLDIGCANGYLLECILRWTQERGLHIIPYRLDFSEKLVALARQRLPQFQDHIFVGNVWNWLPPQTFTYVNTTLDYIPDALREAFVHRLLKRFVEPGGLLLIARYLGRSTDLPIISLEGELQQWGFSIEMVTSSHLEQDPLAQTQVAIIRRAR
jgi:SAM-dependent methyltransferase